jgi:hypothetical protein
MKRSQPSKKPVFTKKLLNDSRPALLLAAAVLVLTACGKPSPTTTTAAPAAAPASAAAGTAPAGEAQLMFVQVADDLKVDAAKSTIRLVKVNQATLYFSDRPKRIAGHMPMARYLQEWSATAGPDNFRTDPPNATLSVYEPGQSENTLAVLKINKPVVEGPDLVYTYNLIEGKMPAGGGATALFIDWIGVGGGVGPGFHGVGVGRRGVGVR